MSQDESRAAGADCPLSPAEQTRNLLVFAACKGLIYLAAPVLYVGVTQAALCDKLGANARLSNLPSTLYFTMWVMPLFVAWFMPYVSYLKRILVCCYLAVAVIEAAVALALMSSLSNDAKIAFVVLQGAVCGGALPTADALIWEVLGRGVSESRRGLTLSLAFGGGPLLAAISSLGSQLLLKGKMAGFELTGWGYPWNFATLFGLAAPMMALAAVLASRTIVPLPEQEVSRQSFVAGVFGGIWNFLTDRVLLIATVVTILIYTGNTITANMNLYSKLALSADPADYAGYQNALRFAFKMVAGLLLGWLLTKTHPRASLLATGSIFVASQIWAFFVSGPWYLVAFGIYGAGELVGVYAPNYILSASRKADIRRNMALVNLMVVPAAPAGQLFGWISDKFAQTPFGDGSVTGFQVSFAVCAALMMAGLAIGRLLLPSRPRPEP